MAGLRVCLLLLLLPSLLAAAGVDSGIEPYERCALCHGLYGDSARDKFPKLAGQPTAYLEKQIDDFLTGKRSNDGGQMAAIVTELAEQEIPLVVEWFSSQAHPSPAADSDAAGGQLFSSAGCGSCHTGKSDSGAMPLLAAQHASYLAKQMRDIRDGARAGGDQDLMKSQLLMLSDAELESIAKYLAAKPRSLNQ